MPDTTVADVTEIEFTSPVQSTAPAVQADLPAAPIQAGGDPFLVMIERAASDPRVDIEKMDRLLQMKERRDAKLARDEFDTAMADAQEAMRAIAKAEPQTARKEAGL